MSTKPYFAGRPLKAEQGRILLVSWHFPPSDAAGALRWQKFARVASDRGWSLDVLALDPDELRSADPVRLEDLPPGVRAYGVPSPNLLLDRAEQKLLKGWHLVRALVDRGGAAADPVRADETRSARHGASRQEAPRRPASLSRQEARWSLGAPRTTARAWWAWREHVRDGDWAREAARLGRYLARKTEYDAVISCGPPHMAHEAGRMLSEGLEIPFVMDMRDPWSLVQRLPERLVSPVWFRLARRFERRCVRRAVVVAGNTEPAAEALRKLYPQAADRIISVLNGYDEEPLPPSPEGGPFVIGYAGTIYLDRDPRPLFQAARRVTEELGLGPDRLRIEFVGNADDYGGMPLNEMARQERIAPHVRTRPFLPRKEAMAFLARCTMLVSLPQDSDMAIPSKVFEYLRFPAWILAMANQESATGLLLRDTHAHVIPPEDVDGMAGAIRRRYLEYLERGRPEPAAAEGGDELSRRRQGEKLLEALEARLRSGSSAGLTRDRRRNPRR